MSSSFAAKAQKAEDFYINLYTDSLKLGTYNYINVDGRMSNGNYFPLDSTSILFSSPHASFFGNTIFIPAYFKPEKVTIRVALRNDLKKFTEFEMYIKRTVDPPLKTEDEIMSEIKSKKKIKVKDKGNEVKTKEK